MSKRKHDPRKLRRPFREVYEKLLKLGLVR